MEKIKIKGINVPNSIEDIEKILSQIKNSVCKIYNNKTSDIGFLCNISVPYYSDLIPVLITSNNILNEMEINNNIIIEMNINNENKKIKLHKSRKKFISSDLNITIIEIKPNIDEFKLINFLEIDEDITNENIYKNKLTYIISYQNEKINILYGLINDIINNEKININKNDLSFSLIFSLNSFKVIGFNYEKLINKGILIKNIINEFYKNYIKNEIRISIKIKKKDIYKEIYFLDNTNEHNNLKELNENNVDLFINDEKIKYKKFFIPIEKGDYSIKLLFKNNIKDCSNMFYNCKKLENIDLSFFNTEKVTNMSYMFARCEKLENIDLSSFDTENVTDMSNMFDHCEKLKNIDLSFFNTEKVINISKMFNFCEELLYIDLFSFETIKPPKIDDIFYCCRSLNKIRIKEEFYEKIKKEIYYKIKIIKS